VLRVLLNYCRATAALFGRRSEPHGRFRNPRFVSFMVQNNQKPLDTDLHDAVLRGRKFVRRVIAVGLAGGAAWIVLESAKALSVF
jgi:hypothetical protein